MNQVSSSTYRPVCIGLHWPERIGPSRKVRFVQKTALRRNTSRNTLQASLSGTFRQRKDVVNRCLEFAPEDDVPMHLPNGETDRKSNRCKSALWVGVAREDVKCLGAWENMLITEARHLLFLFLIFRIVSNFNIMKTFLVHVGLFRCFHSPPNSDMDYRIFNVLMTFCLMFCMRMHTRGPRFVVSSEGLS